MRILIVPHDAGNFAPLMAWRFRELGHEARCIVFSQSYLGYTVEYPDCVIGGRGIKELLLLEVKRWRVFFHAFKYNVVVFTYGSTILPNPAFIGFGLSSKITPLIRAAYSFYSLPFSWFMWDVRALKKMGKRIGVIFQGGDARRGDILKKRGLLDIDEEPPGYYRPFMDKIKARRARLWDRYADAIWYHNPDLGWGLPKKAKFLAYPLEVDK